MPLIYTASTLLSLVIFPILIRNPLTDVFMDGDPRKFEVFLRERKAFIADAMIRLFTPDQPRTTNE